MKISSAVISNIGNARKINEDNYSVNGVFSKKAKITEETYSCEDENSGIYAVCDGMGGESNGYEASYICVWLLNEYHKEQKVLDLDAMNKYFLEANDLLCKYITQYGQKRSGSTVALLHISNGKATVFNVGDSRIYFLRNKELVQVSVDHTSAQRMVNMGLLTPEKAKQDRQRHTLTQHIGIPEEELVIEPFQSETISLKKKDRFLLCSDGLSDMLDDEEIRDILLKNKKSADEACRELVDEALKNGGKDNITALVVDIH